MEIHGVWDLEIEGRLLRRAFESYEKIEFKFIEYFSFLTFRISLITSIGIFIKQVEGMELKRLKKSMVVSLQDIIFI